MNHNYKLEDFRKPEFESDTDLQNSIVSFLLCDTLELPSVLEKRLEDIINNMISDYEQENNIVIPIENMDVENCIVVDTESNKLSLEVYIGFDIDKELLYKNEIITPDDEHFNTIMNFFFIKLNEYALNRVRKIVSCVQ